jgi:hypothetical protein
MELEKEPALGFPLFSSICLVALSAFSCTLFLIRERTVKVGKKWGITYYSGPCCP